MPRFAHIADVHLGGWKYPELQSLNFQSFSMAIERCIKEKVEFVLIAGDLFDTAFPGIEVLKETFAEFRKLKDAKIPCFLIAGSHDFSVSGKTFLDVLDRAGFCKNVENYEYDEEKDIITLHPVIHGGVAFYGYPGRKSGLEVPQIRKIKLNDSPGMFKIFMLHTTLDKVKGNLPIDSVEADKLPKADYYAMGHVHIDYQYEKFVYPGPLYPNNFQELEDLHYGGFYIVDTDSMTPMKKIDLKIKDVISIMVEIKDAHTATQKIISELEKREIENKIILLRLTGEVENGKHSDIKFPQIEEFAKKKGAYSILRNTHELKVKELEMEINVTDSDNIEEETIKNYAQGNPSKFNILINDLIEVLSIEKQEGETNDTFTTRLLGGAKKILNF